MFSKCIDDSGVSRVTSTSLRRSLSVTSAARLISESVNPIRMLASVFMLHGTTIIPSVRKEPLEMVAA
ncbi:hypothetical protein ACVWWN_003426 [Mycobacterium sp. URHB0021]|jgi:hypothetical protein